LDTAVRNDWVEIRNEVLAPNERAPQNPEDTKATPLVMWTRGFLVNETARTGDEVSIRTLTGRIATGTLVDVNPRHIHDFGNPVHELIQLGVELKEELKTL